MADISITATSVSRVDGNTETANAGATITAGQAVYKDSSSTWQLADTDSATAAAHSVYGIALNGGASGQPVTVALAGATINIGATVAVGTIYVLSGTAGGICPTTDLATGDYTFVIGIATTTGRLKLILQGGEVAVP